jgi:hypothetical protein
MELIQRANELLMPVFENFSNVCDLQRCAEDIRFGSDPPRFAVCDPCGGRICEVGARAPERSKEICLHCGSRLRAIEWNDCLLDADHLILSPEEQTLLRRILDAAHRAASSVKEQTAIAALLFRLPKANAPVIPLRRDPK